MRKLKVILFTLSGALCGAGLMYLLLPAICAFFVGPIYGEDQMSQNFTIFVVGTALFAIFGALFGWIAANRLTYPRL